MPNPRAISIVLIASLACAGPKKDTPAKKNEVIVLGMIHSGHRTNPRYSIDIVKKIIRSIKPDYILTEIPPDRLPIAQGQFRRAGRITEPRVLVFPEYTDALFPLTRETDFVIVPCAGWTKKMADDVVHQFALHVLVQHGSVLRHRQHRLRAYGGGVVYLAWSHGRCPAGTLSSPPVPVVLHRARVPWPPPLIALRSSVCQRPCHRRWLGPPLASPGSAVGR